VACIELSHVTCELVVPKIRYMDESYHNRDMTHSYTNPTDDISQKVALQPYCMVDSVVSRLLRNSTSFIYDRHSSLICNRDMTHSSFIYDRDMTQSAFIYDSFLIHIRLIHIRS